MNSATRPLRDTMDEYKEILKGLFVCLFVYSCDNKGVK